MIAPLAQFIDWYALQVAAMLPSFRKCAKGDSKLTEAIAFLNGPNFIPAESNPADLEFTSNIHFKFPSPHRANLQRTTSFTDAFIVAEKIGRNSRLSFCCMAAAIFGIIGIGFR